MTRNSISVFFVCFFFLRFNYRADETRQNPETKRVIIRWNVQAVYDCASGYRKPFIEAFVPVLADCFRITVIPLTCSSSGNSSSGGGGSVPDYDPPAANPLLHTDAGDGVPVDRRHVGHIPATTVAAGELVNAPTSRTREQEVAFYPSFFLQFRTLFLRPLLAE